MCVLIIDWIRFSPARFSVALCVALLLLFVFFAQLSDAWEDEDDVRMAAAPATCGGSGGGNGVCMYDEGG